MRASELFEDTGERVRSDALDLLMSLMASGQDSVDTDVLVQHLEDLGHAVTPEALISMFDNEDRPDFIDNITANTVTLGTPKPADEADPDAEFEKKTSRQAMKNLKRQASQRKGLSKGL